MCGLLLESKAIEVKVPTHPAESTVSVVHPGSASTFVTKSAIKTGCTATTRIKLKTAVLFNKVHLQKQSNRKLFKKLMKTSSIRCCIPKRVNIKCREVLTRLLPF